MLVKSAAEQPHPEKKPATTDDTQRLLRGHTAGASERVAGGLRACLWKRDKTGAFDLGVSTRRQNEGREGPRSRNGARLAITEGHFDVRPGGLLFERHAAGNAGIADGPYERPVGRINGHQRAVRDRMCPCSKRPHTDMIGHERNASLQGPDHRRRTRRV